METTKPVRRKWTEGVCKDCGRLRSTTIITFWATGMPYRVCADCIKPYRGVILKPYTEEHKRETLEQWRAARERALKG